MADKKQYCTFYLENLCFGVDVLKIQEVFRHNDETCVPLASQAVKGLINLRGQILTAIDLRSLLGMKDRPGDLNPVNVVVNTEGNVVSSLMVDEIGDVIELSEDECEAPPDTLDAGMKELILEVYKLEKELVLVLDIDRVVQTEALKV